MRADHSQVIKYTVRLSPFQNKRLLRLRHHGIPDDAEPRSVSQLVREGLRLLYEQRFGDAK